MINVVTAAGDTVKLVVAALVLAAGVGVFYYFGAQPTYVRVLGLLVLAAAATGVALLSAPGKAAWDFIKESRLELRKVVWPTRKETIQVTLVVIALVIVIALFLWLVDWALLKATQALFG